MNEDIQRDACLVYLFIMASSAYLSVFISSMLRESVGLWKDSKKDIECPS